MNDQYWGWILSVLGLVGFYVTGKKIWWGWWLNVAAQAVWYAYAIATQQWGFLVMTTMYTIIFTKNAIEWTKEHRAPHVIEGWDDNAVSYMQEDVKLTEKLYRPDGAWKKEHRVPEPPIQHEFVVDVLGYQTEEAMQIRIHDEIKEWLSTLSEDEKNGRLETYMEESPINPYMRKILVVIKK